MDDRQVLANIDGGVLGGVSVEQAVALGYLAENGEIPEDMGEDKEGGI